MSRKKKIDDFFREKLNDRPFDFDESSWLKFEKMKPEPEEKNGSGWKWLVLAIALLVITFVGWFATNQLNVSSKVSNEQQSISKQDEISSLKNSDRSNDSEKSSAPITIEKSDEQKNVWAEKQNPNTSSSYESNAHENHSVKLSSQKNSASASTELNPTSQNEIKSQPIDATHEENNNGNEMSLSISKRGIDSLQQDILHNTSYSDSSLRSSSDETHQQSEKENSKIDSAIAIQSSSTFIDTARQMIALSISPLLGSALTSGESLSANAGIATISVSPVIGIDINKNLSAKLNMHILPLYTSIGGLSATKTFVHSYSSFGFESDSESVIVRRLHYISMPVLLDYSFQKNHLLLGASASYLITTSAIVYTQRSSSFGLISQESKNVFGYMKGFHPFAFNIILGYERELKSDWRWGISAFADLNDISKDDYYGVNNFNGNIGVRSWLSFDLIDWKKNN